LASKWYALGCKANKERFIWKKLQAEGYDVFYPRISYGIKKLRFKPFFPRYLFIRLDLDLIGLSKINNMPYTNGLVSIEGRPFHIPDAMIEAIRKKIDEINSSYEEADKKEQVSTASGFLDLEHLLDIERPDAERLTFLNHIFSE
jgi:transcription antitermination factor NusG